MRYRSLGNSGTIVSEFALGTMTFGAETSETEAHGILDHYVDSGGNFIDTADVYAAGRSEEIIGQWLKAEGRRADGIVLATKARFPTSDEPNGVGVSRRHLRHALEASLRRLKVENIDLYQLHAWEQITPLEETLRFLDDATRAGKINHYGVSNYTAWQLTKAVGVAERHGQPAPVTLQPHYNLLTRGIELETVDAALDANIGLLPWSPLAGGWLTGKYRRGEAPEPGTRYAKPGDQQAREDRDGDDRVWDILDVVRAIADKHSATSAQVALAWLLDRPAVSSVILGARTLNQLDDNLGSINLRLTSSDFDQLDRISAPRFHEYPYSDGARRDRERNVEGSR